MKRDRVYVPELPTYVVLLRSLMYGYGFTRPGYSHCDEFRSVRDIWLYPWKEAFWNAVKRIFCYLKGTSDVASFTDFCDRGLYGCGISRFGLSLRTDVEDTFDKVMFVQSIGNSGLSSEEGIWMKRPKAIPNERSKHIDVSVITLFSSERKNSKYEKIGLKKTLSWMCSSNKPKIVEVLEQPETQKLALSQSREVVGWEYEGSL
ncbi:hypothetical protein Tco_1163281 [Tanacetum coccineum]